VALARQPPQGYDALISCGLAGGLRDDLPTGTIVIPRDVRRPDGTMLHCDHELTESLIAGARRLGIEPVVENIVTASSVVVGEERKRWAGEGYAAADMETGLLTGRVAAVRVILDTPLNELSSDWLNPTIAMLKPWNWPQAIWLGRNAPHCARLAARAIVILSPVEGPRQITASYEPQEIRPVPKSSPPA
jgi:Phosphorylase superfamily